MWSCLSFQRLQTKTEPQTGQEPTHKTQRHTTPHASVSHPVCSIMMDLGPWMMHMVSMEINTAHRLLHQPETPVKEPESESMLGEKKCSAALVVNTNFIKFLNGLSPDSFRLFL